MKNTCACVYWCSDGWRKWSFVKQALWDLKRFFSFSGVQKIARCKAHLLCLSWSWDPCDPGKHWALGPLAAVRKGEAECIGEGNSCSCYIMSGSQVTPWGCLCSGEHLCRHLLFVWRFLGAHNTLLREPCWAGGRWHSQTPALGHAVQGRKKLPHRLHLDCVKGAQSKSSLWFRWLAQPRATKELAVCCEGLSTPEIFP